MTGSWLRDLIVSSAMGGVVIAGAVLAGFALSDRDGLGRLLWEVGGVGVIALLWFFLGMLFTIVLIGTGTMTRPQGYGPGRLQRIGVFVQPCRAEAGSARR